MTEEHKYSRGLPLSIEPYRHSDLDDMMEIENQSFPAPWTRNSYEQLAVLDDVDIWIARLGPELVGYMLLQRSGDDMELHTFAVKPKYRRQGIGAKLLEHMRDQARQKGVIRIHLKVRPSNYEAKALYEKFGFKIMGMWHAYYHDDGEDALVMKMELN